MPSISLIIPVYNVEHYIADTLSSVFNQTCQDFECILVDDCSTDESIAVADKVIAESGRAGMFRIIKQEKNQGVSAARNVGMKNATGDYVLFMDSDDKLYLNAIETLKSLADKYPGVDLVQGNFLLEDPSDFRNLIHFEKGKFPEYVKDSTSIRKMMLHWSFPIVANNRLVRRSFLFENNLFFKEGIIHEDEHWRWLIHKYVKTLAITDICTYWYRTSSFGSIMNNPDYTKSVLSKLDIFEFIALHGDSEADICFDIHFLSYDVKIKCWKNVSDKNAVYAKLDKVVDSLTAANVDRRLIRNLKLFRLPVWLLDNKMFAKAYYEYEKSNGLIYGSMFS